MGKRAMLLLLCIALAGPAGAKVRKAVVIIPDAATSGINLSTGKSITSYTVSEFVNSGRFMVVDRKNLDRILEEMKLQLTGLTETETAKKVGRLLNADKFVFVSVSRTGGISMVEHEEQFVCKLDVTDIETGIVETSMTETVNGINNVYPLLKKMTAAVMERIGLSVQVLSLSGETAYLDAGSKDGIARGRAYDVKMVTSVVRDKAGKEVFRKKEIVGKLTITDVDEHSSEARFSLSRSGVRVQEGSVLELTGGP